jgi:hypothetical protein
LRALGFFLRLADFGSNNFSLGRNNCFGRAVGASFAGLTQLRVAPTSLPVPRSATSAKQNLAFERHTCESCLDYAGSPFFIVMSLNFAPLNAYAESGSDEDSKTEKVEEKLKPRRQPHQRSFPEQL